MLAAAAGANLIPFPPGDMWNVLEKMVPEKYRDVNRRAFDIALERVSGIKNPEQAIDI